MASNGLVFRPGRGPSFILVGLVLIVVILFYSYWGVSSKNNKLLRDVSVLQDRLRVLAARKLTADKKGSALLTQITQLQDDKEQRDKVISSKDDKNAELSESLQKKEIELSKVRHQEQNYLMELEKLRKGVNSSSSGLKTLKGKADQLLKSYQDIKANYSSLLQQTTKLTSQRDLYLKELTNVKEELEDLKKKTVDKVPTKPTKEGNEEPAKGDSERGNTDKKKPDEPEKPVPSISEMNKRGAGNVNSAANDSDLTNKKASRSKAQSEEITGSVTESSTGILDQLKQGILGGPDKDEKEMTKDHEGVQQPTEKSSPRDGNSQQENEDEGNDERDDQEENEKKVMDKRQGQNTPINSEEKDMEEKEKTESTRDQEDENSEENENEGNKDDESDNDVDDAQKDEGEDTLIPKQPLFRDNGQRKVMFPPDSSKDTRGLPNTDNKQLPIGNPRQRFDPGRSRNTLDNLGVGRRME